MFTAIFDLDGTLADTSGDLLAAANAQFIAQGYAAPLTSRDRNTALLGGRAMLRLGAERLGLDDEFVDAGYAPLLEFYEKNLAEQTRFYDGALQTIETLRAAGWKTAICTNKPINLAQKLISQLGASALFDTIVGVNSIPERKPHPAPIYLVMKTVGASAKRTILVGDTTTDYDAATHSGIDILLVDFDNTKIGEVHNNAPVAKDFSDVKQHLLAWRAVCENA